MLREVDPTVTLPYLDTTLDQYMDESAQSLIWSEDFLGGGDGVVSNGPFANWQTNDGPLTRNIGVPDTKLYTHDQIENTTRCTRMSEICNGGTDAENNPLVNTGLEWHHGDVHVYVGGQMSSLQTSSYDPVFFMHHAFVDMIWHEFRENSRRSGVDPNNDYPTDNFGDADHAPDADLGIQFANNLTLTVRDGIDENSIHPSFRYRYQPRPTCSRGRDCPSNKLRCVQRENRYMCISKTLVEYQSDLQIDAATNGNLGTGSNGETVIIRRPDPFPNNNRGNLSPTFIHPHRHGVSRWSFRDRFMRFGGNRRRVAIIDQCPIPEPEHKPVQNSFCANGKADIREWVYVAVRVLSQRAPDYKRYGSFPVRNGQVRAGSDIYAADGYSRLRSSLEQGNPKAYEKCRTDHDPAGEIYIRTDGINYQGTYTEYAIIDQRLPLAVSVAYVAVKAPVNGRTSDVFLSAYDSCGRVCIPSCLNARTNKYEPCSGALSINSRSPLQYSKNFADTVLDIFDVQSQKHCPQMNNERIHISFFCDYSNEWPWKMALTQPGAQPHVWKAQLRKKAAAAKRANLKRGNSKKPMKSQKLHSKYMFSILNL